MSVPAPFRTDQRLDGVCSSESLLGQNVLAAFPRWTKDVEAALGPVSDDRAMASDVQQLMLSPVPVPAGPHAPRNLSKLEPQRRAQRHGNAIQPADTPGDGSRCVTRNVLATLVASRIQRRLDAR